MLTFGQVLGRGNNSLLLCLYKYSSIIGYHQNSWRESKWSKHINIRRDWVSTEYNDIYACKYAMHKYGSMRLCTYKITIK